MNNIPQEQNNQNRLELLAAQRQLYSDAKRLQMIGIIVSIPTVIMWSVVVAIFPMCAVYAAFWSIMATLIDILLLSKLQKSFQEKAAKIQQMFDCDVLQFDWANLSCGNRVEQETIIDAYNRYKLKNPDIKKLQNWYPVIVEQLPIYQARIVCQRANVWWDAKLRRRYSKWIIFILLALTVIVLTIGLVGGLTLEKFVLAVLAPLTPAFFFGLRQYNEHNEAAAKLDKLRENAEALVQQLISRRYTPLDIERESYSLQAQIYDNRRLSPLILDWLYSRLRNKDEEMMNKGAEFLVQDLLQNP